MFIVFIFSFQDLRSDLILVWALICKSLFPPNSLSLSSYSYFVAEHRPCWSRQYKHCSWLWWPHPSLTLLAAGLGGAESPGDGRGGHRNRDDRNKVYHTQGSNWSSPSRASDWFRHGKAEARVELTFSLTPMCSFPHWPRCCSGSGKAEGDTGQGNRRKATETGLSLCIFLKYESSTEPTLTTGYLEYFC